ncbi:TadE/TadG family type IV pilus assembly protein [Palleronia sp. KMU-117]|uniref:TadE/TadG family type IV pilus assembly protein n=1 Tax=Palleronia sp. KMU-117 TaxID=3434108 RepID=UPI003D76139F
MKRGIRTINSASARRFARDESGTTLVELALVIALFLLLFFAVLDFGRMGSDYVMAEKALQRAVRVAATRPAACPGVPETHQPGAFLPGTTPPRYGTLCRAAPGVVCATPAEITCQGDLSNATVAEIWWGADRAPGGVPGIREVLPSNAEPRHLVFRYTTDPDLGFLGGPFVPIVTVELRDLDFRYTTPLGRLAGIAGVANAGTRGDNDIPFPTISVSLPGEDLAQGGDG